MLAVAGDCGRAVDREISKELIGYTLTFRDKDEKPVKSFTLDTNGELISAADWTSEGIGKVTPGADYLRELEKN